MAQPSAITYSKLPDGSWGIRGTNLVPGAVVAVAKRDGTTKHETIDRIVRQGNGLQWATVVPSGPARQGSRSPARGPERRPAPPPASSVVPPIETLPFPEDAPARPQAQRAMTYEGPGLRLVVTAERATLTFELRRDRGRAVPSPIPTAASTRIQ
jgi:hypothetical protein